MAKTHAKIKPVPSFKGLSDKEVIKMLFKNFHITGNSKTGISWDMPAGDVANNGSCPGMTEACITRLPLKDGSEGKMLTCYAQQGLYAWGQPNYHNNKNLIEGALADGISLDIISEALTMFLDRESGIDDLIRLHGSGDLYSIPYIKLLILVAKKLALRGKKLYGYTRSFAVPTLVPYIVELAKVMDLNISADRFNWELAGSVYSAYPGLFRRVAIMQEANATWILRLQNEYGIRKHQVILFPIHKGKQKDKATGKTVLKMVEPMPGQAICPSMLGVFDTDIAPACVQCKAICHS